MTTLTDKIVLITGASAGIGEATARALAREGAKLILVARREEKLQSLAKELVEKHQTQSLVLPLNLREFAQVEKSLKNLPADWREVDILVNNAGLVRGLQKLYTMDSEDWHEVIDVNVKALIAVTNSIVPGMVERGEGHVINLGSIAGRESYPNGAVYCATKFAVRAISRGLKMDLNETPIRVTSIDPGLVETEFSVVRFKGDKEKAKAPYRGLTALKGEDIADAIVWSASRPAHVNISEMLIFPTAQASSVQVHRD
jgi:3-hydroxy acid dehydrogenase / malonic semialdehyde reductase